MTISQSVWPSATTTWDSLEPYATGERAYATLYNNYHPTGRRFAEFRDIVWYNFARVNIYFNEAKIIETQEVAAMSLTELFANVGGVIGLWAGLSIITVLEFASLPIRLLYFYIAAKIKPSRVFIETN